MIGLRYDELQGGWTFFKQMASELRSKGHSIIFVTFRFPNKPARECVDGIEVFRVRSLVLQQLPLYLPDPNDLGNILKSIFARKVDIVYDVSSGISPIGSLIFVYLKAWRIQLPWITHVCGELKEFKENLIRRILFEFYLRLIANLSMVHSDSVLVTGERILRRVMSLSVRRQKLKIVRVGLKETLTYHTIQHVSQAAARTTLGLSPSDFVVGSVGRLAYGKGFETLIRASASLESSIPELKIVIVGSGSLEGKLRRLANDKLSDGKVLFTGWVDSPVQILPALDVFVSMSSSEAGISAALLEAMSVELPCVTTPFTDTIKSMVNGIIISSPNPSELASALLTLHKNVSLRKTLARNALLSAENTLKMYNWEDYSSKVDQVISSLLQFRKEEGLLQIA